MGAEDERQIEANRRRRLYLTQKIQNNLAEQHRREQEYYQNEIAFLNHEMQMIQSNPYYDNRTKMEINNMYENLKNIHTNYFNDSCERYSDINSILKQNIKNIIYNEKDFNEVRYAKKILKKSVSMALGFVPVLGNAKGIVESITGKDLISDEELNGLERVYAGVSALPVIGDIIGWENWVMKIIEKLFKI